MPTNRFGDRNISSFTLEEFIKHVTPHVRKTVYSIVGKQRYAEDIIQEVYAKLLEGLASFKGKAKISTWVISISRNTAIDYNKKMNREVPASDSIEEGRDINSYLESASNMGEKDYCLSMSVREILETMPERLRDILIKKEIEGLTYKELSESLNLTRRQVENLLNKARIMFKDMCLNSKLI